MDIRRETLLDVRLPVRRRVYNPKVHEIGGVSRCRRGSGDIKM